MKIEELNLLIQEGEGLTVEFKEKYSPKIDKDIVAFSNTKGGAVLLGVNDDGKIIGEILTNRMKASIIELARNCEPSIDVKIVQVEKVVVVIVEEGHEKPYSCSSGYFRRLDAVTQKMTQKEMRLILRESLDGAFEDFLRNDFSLSGISFDKVEAFLRETKTTYKVTDSSSLTAFLTSLGVYKDGKVNNAGILMFASDVGQFIPHAEIILGAFKGLNKNYIYDRKDVREDLLAQLNEAIVFLAKHLNVRSEIKGISRKDIYEIPLDALREALANAIIHRDYNMKGTSIYVSVFDDRVEIVNPGGLPVGITKDNFGTRSIRRNLIIADLFHRIGLVERMGSGIEKMRSFARSAGLKEPDFKSDTFFQTVFYRNPEFSLKKNVIASAEERAQERAQKSTQKSTQKSAQKIIELIRQNKFITRAELASNLGLSESGIKKQLKKLQNEGILKRIGPDKGGYWEIIRK